MHNDEATPLLRASANNTDRTVTRSQLPTISPTVRRVGALEPDQIVFEDLVNHDGLNFENHPTEFAFALIVLLHLRKIRTKVSPTDGPYERWLATEINMRDADALERQIKDTWTAFLAEYRTVRDIETVLWSKFPLDEGATRTYRVADFLADCDSPASLTLHPLITSSLEHAWKHGVSLEYSSSPTSSWLVRYDRLATPRVTHLIDWTSHLVFLALLAHYVLYPVEQPHTTDRWLQYQYGVREVLLVVLPLSFAPRSRSLANTSPLLASFAFLASLPCMPHPTNFPFALMQWAVVLHPFGLNLPEAPSHLFLLQRGCSLPLAVLVQRGLSRIMGPVILFFLPLLLLATYLLSLSLVDTFLRTYFATAFSSIATATPTETRFTFLCFLFIVIIFLFTSVFVLATTTSSARTSSEPWDRYSEAIGHTARGAFARATASYIDPYTFPPPFNIVHILLIRVPSAIAHLFRIQIPGLTGAERVLWRTIVGPFTAFVALLFWRPGRSLPYSRGSQSTSAS